MKKLIELLKEIKDAGEKQVINSVIHITPETANISIIKENFNVLPKSPAWYSAYNRIMNSL